jgi:integrase
VWLPSAAQTLLQQMDPTRIVFSGPHGNPIRSLDKAMRSICQDFGVERETPHDLRRTHGTTITGLGFGRDAMNRVQNHKEGGIGSVYNRHQYWRIMETVAQKLMALIHGSLEHVVVAFNGTR